LYLTKRSHIYWPIHWEKNIEDLHNLKKMIIRLNTYQEDEYYQLRLSEHEKRFGKKFKANLNVSNEVFSEKVKK